MKALARCVCALAAVSLGVLMPAAAPGAEPALRLRIVGGLADVNQYTRHEAPFWTQTLPRLTGGRVSADIVPYDQAGIRAPEMLRLMQLGAVPFGTALLSRISVNDPEVAAADLAALNPDMASLRRSVAAFRPYLERMLLERYGIKVLAVYTYPAQMVFCTQPFAGLADLSGRRVRTATPSQADLMRSFGAQPVATEFSEIITRVKSGAVDCAITGAMSGNTIGLHEITTHLHTQAIGWGLSVFGVNLAAWMALPQDLRSVLEAELPRVEAAIWDESERETGDGVACNLGQGTCKAGRRGRMQAARDGSGDAQRLRAAFESAVLGQWVQRCGAGCARVWNQYLAPVAGVKAREQP